MGIYTKNALFALKYIKYAKSSVYMSRFRSYTTRWERKASIYVHWPYCEKRCTYCNFNKYISNDVNHDRMRDCLVQETKTLLNLSGIDQVTTVFFGGGTPSLAQPKTIESILDTIHRESHLQDGAEITLEANPTSSEASKLREFVEAGINRLSLGIQSIIEEDLVMLGRQHSAEEALRCLELCRRLLPGRVSVDVIFGRPGQTNKSWGEELQRILPLCDDHVSLYQLTLERGTALFKLQQNGKIVVPDVEVMADMYQEAVQLMSCAGFNRYEVSNFARSHQAQSRHNKHYWEGGEYIGVGPGAHGRFVPVATNIREARIQTLEPEPWMREVERYGHGTRKTVPQTMQDRLQELIMVGLRTSSGITAEMWHLITPCSLQSIFMGQKVDQMKNERLIDITESFLKATPRGLDVADCIACELILVLQEYFESNK